MTEKQTLSCYKEDANNLKLFFLEEKVLDNST